MSAHACVAETPTVGGSSVRSGYRQALARTTSTHGTGPSRQRPTLANPEGGGLVRDGPAAKDAGPLPGGREQAALTDTGELAAAESNAGLTDHGDGKEQVDIRSAFRLVEGVFERNTFDRNQDALTRDAIYAQDASRKTLGLLAYEGGTICVLVVDPAARRTGIGRQLVRAHAALCSGATIKVQADRSEGTVQFYEACGLELDAGATDAPDCRAMRAGRRQVLEAVPQQSLPGIAMVRDQFPETHPFFGAEHAPFLRRRLEAAEPVLLAGLSEGKDGAISVDPGALQRVWDTVKELFDYELGGDWGGSALGADALQHLFETAVNEFRPHRLVYDVGAGCGFVVFALRVLGITAGGCEASTTLRDGANRIGRRYFGSAWEPIEATMRPVSGKVTLRPTHRRKHCSCWTAPTSGS